MRDADVEPLPSLPQSQWTALCRLIRERMGAMLLRTDLSPDQLWYLSQVANWTITTEREAMTFDLVLERIADRNSYGG